MNPATYYIEYKYNGVVRYSYTVQAKNPILALKCAEVLKNTGPKWISSWTNYQKQEIVISTTVR